MPKWKGLFLNSNSKPENLKLKIWNSLNHFSDPDKKPVKVEIYFLLQITLYYIYFSLFITNVLE